MQLIITNFLQQHKQKHKLNIGTYNNETGKKDCIPCPIGTYNNQSGSTSCKKCVLGRFRNNVKGISYWDCLRCPLGTYNDIEGNYECFNCPEGTYNPDYNVSLFHIHNWVVQNGGHASFQGGVLLLGEHGSEVLYH